MCVCVCIHAYIFVSPNPEQVAESTNAQNTLNTLTVTFRANLRLEPGSAPIYIDIDR